MTLSGATYPGSLLSPGIDVIESDFIGDDLSCWRVIDGELVKYNIEPIRQSALNKLNERMAEMRSQLVTSLPGQDMVYIRKEEEAKSYLNSIAPVLEDYPLIAAEIGITADTAYQIAQIWMAMSHFWISAAADLEGLRMRIGNAIAQAETEEEIETALSILN